MKKYIFALIALSLISVSSIHANECCTRGLYLGGFGGANYLDIGSGSGIKVGFIGGAFLGYKFENSLRIEGELSYRRNTLKKPSPYGHLRSTHETYAVMGNIYYDLDLGCNFTPYIGQGIGYAHNRSKASLAGYHASSKANRFAYQAMVGISYKIFEKTSIGLEYKFFIPARCIYDHAIVANTKYCF